jgi:hypothetical protein
MFMLHIRRLLKKTSTTYLQRNLALLELAQSKATEARIFWRTAELGSWELVSPTWRAVGEKIWFRFHFQGRLLDRPVASVKATSCGIKLALLNSANPIPDPFEVRWLEPVTDYPSDPQRLWRVIHSWLSREYPGYRIRRCAKSTDRMRTLSILFLRVAFLHYGKEYCLIAADESSGDDISLVVGQALLWLEVAHPKMRLEQIPILHILVPSTFSAIVHHRCQYFDPSQVQIEVWVYEPSEADPCRFMRATALPELKENIDYHWPVLGPFCWSADLEKVLNLAPDLIGRYPRFYEYDSLRLRGLEFAQVFGMERDRICFGVGSARTELTPDNFDVLKELVREILFYRRSDSPDRQHPYYRLQSERWLESLILEDIPRLFPEMAPEAVYSQIPVYVGRNPGRIDILGANVQGDLVIMELKVSADSDLPVQALDYWGRVIEHNRNGDFMRRGYFSETGLNRRPPVVYLVAPVFSFHDSTELLLRYLDPNLEIHKIAINENWRSGVKILNRMRYYRDALMSNIKAGTQAGLCLLVLLGFFVRIFLRGFNG